MAKTLFYGLLFSFFLIYTSIYLRINQLPLGGILTVLGIGLLIIAFTIQQIFFTISKHTRTILFFLHTLFIISISIILLFKYMFWWENWWERVFLLSVLAISTFSFSLFAFVFHKKYKQQIDNPLFRIWKKNLLIPFFCLTPLILTAFINEDTFDDLFHSKREPKPPMTFYSKIDLGCIFSHDSIKFYYDSAQYFRLQENYSQELNILEKILLKDSTSVCLYHEQGIAYQGMLAYQKAIKSYDLAIRFDSSFIASYLNRGLVKMFIKDYQGAEDDFNKCINLNSSIPAIYLNRGLLYTRLEERVKACKDFQKALSLVNDEDEKLYVLWVMQEHCD